MILSRCTSILDEKGRTTKFTNFDRLQIVKDVIENMAGNGLRTIALAYRDFPADSPPDWEQENGVVSNLTCIGITGIEDPVRPEVCVVFLV